MKCRKLNIVRKRRPVGSVSELDHMIANLGNPRMAEKLRIHKVVAEIVEIGTEM